MKKILSFFVAISLALPSFANEGMWIPLLLGKNYEDMKAHGLQLTPEDIYSINNGSLKDAIVSFGGFCTGEIISDKGLILTNHHCGFGSIQSHSSTDHNYLKDGFWASSFEEELENPDLFVRFLVRMEDVTNQVVDELNDDMSEDDRLAKIREIGRKLASEATEGTDYEADVKSFYHGNEFYLFVYERYSDIRLVGAPPSSIGKFGGDTDNWMWTRHTGDFSLFRVYANGDNQPAKYAAENVPFAPKHHLPISIDGIKEGDFTMIMGYPGSTDRYLSSYGVNQAIEKYNPTVVKIRDKKLAIMRDYMSQSDANRIQYASKYAQTANYWKYYIGQTEQLKNNNVYDKKKAIENEFEAWVNKSDTRKAKYGQTINLLKQGYAEKDNYVVNNVYVLEAGLIGPELPLFAFRLGRQLNAYVAAVEEENTEKADAIKASILAYAKEFYGGYSEELDRNMATALFGMYYNDIPTDQQPAFLKEAGEKYKGDMAKYVANLFGKTMLLDTVKLEKFLAKPKAKVLENDPALVAGNSLIDIYRSGGSDNKATEDKLEKGYRLLTAGLREMHPDRNYTPDANSTMRLTYGTVGSYNPRDGVHYNFYTTANGILQKKDNTDDEFVVPDKLDELISNKTFGRYANKDGELPVCFIHNTDITGGNSGSPVINGKGELIGCAFDGNWEAMSGDIFFENELQRTISVDARYILFVIDKYAGAHNLIKEMTIVDTDARENALKAAALKKEKLEAADADN